MTPIVVDASALVEYLLRSARGRTLDAILERDDGDLHIPALCDVEVAAVLRRALLAGALDRVRAAEALEDLRDLPLIRHGHQLLLGRILLLGRNFSAYDATYVALAERLDAALLTADDRLARAVQAHLPLELA